MKTQRKSCPNGKGTYALLPETDRGHIFNVAGGVQILTSTYTDGALRANALGCDFISDLLVPDMFDVIAKRNGLKMLADHEGNRDWQQEPHVTYLSPKGNIYIDRLSTGTTMVSLYSPEGVLLERAFVETKAC